jgi:hypothetical protein
MSSSRPTRWSKTRRRKQRGSGRSRNCRRRIGTAPQADRADMIEPISEIWNDVAAVRTTASWLQWLAIILVFLGGILQAAKIVVDRRERALTAIEQHPNNQPIRSGSATVELIEVSTRAANAHFMDSGAYIAFGRQNDAMLVMRSLDSFANQNGQGEIRWRSVLTLDASDSAIGHPIRFLRDAEFLQIGFGQLPANSEIKNGSVVLTLNGVVRLEIAVPAQLMDNDRVFVGDLEAFKGSLQ